VDASGHGGLDNRTDVFIFNGSFVFMESGFLVSVDSGNVLKVALTALVANGAVERVVGEQEFHDATTSK
jgi:hypothetical protein